jgi:TolB-like protein
MAHSSLSARLSVVTIDPGDTDMATFRISQFLKEAHRRRVFAVLAIYIVGAWIVLQVAATLFPGWHIPDQAIRFVWIGAVLLSPVAILFGWKYDISSQGIRRTAAAGEAADSVALTRNDFGVIALLALLCLAILGGVLKEIVGIRGAPQPQLVASEVPRNSIAVLPFVNMSGDASNEYFSDGITEQLLNELTRVSGLHVAARTSSFYFKNRNEPMKKIAQELGVRTLLEGSVRRSGNTVRITAQLINADDGYHLWSDTFDRALDDILLVQDEISQAIVETLRVEFMVEADRQRSVPATDNLDAYDIYLRAMAYRRSDMADAVKKSNELLQDAIDLAPDFALALDALAYGYLLQSYNGSLSIDDATSKAEGLLVKALQIQHDLEEAHASFGLLKTRLAQFDEANDFFETALAINPNYFGGQVNYGLSLVLQSRLKEASAAYLRAQALDPLNANLNFNLGALLMLMGQFESGRQFIEKASTIQPGMVRARAALTHWFAVYGKLVEAIQNGEAVVRDFPDAVLNKAALVRAYVALGLVDEARRVLSEAEDLMPENEHLRNTLVDLWTAENDFDSIYRFAEEEFATVDANIGDPLTFAERANVFRYAWTLLMQDDNELASELLYWVSGGDSGIAAKTYDEIYYLKMLALSYQRTGRDEDADALLVQCLDLVEAARENGWATPTLHVRAAEVHALRGDTDNAISHLEAAFDKGWRGVNTLESGVYWESLQSDPDLERIKVLIYNDLEAQRRRLLDESDEADRPGTPLVAIPENRD